MNPYRRMKIPIWLGFALALPLHSNLLKEVTWMAKKSNDDDKIPRDHFVIGRAVGVIDHFTIGYDADTGVPRIHELDPASLRSEISYQKKNGKDKVLYSTPVEGFSALDESFIEQLKKRFDYLIAVDTNTINKPPRTNGCRISVCSSCAVPIPLSEVTDQIAFNTVAAHLIYDSGPVVNPEPLGWHLIIQKLSGIPSLSSKRIAIVVDSELGLHLDINARKIPYYGEHILPPNMTLIYASSDKPEIFANYMLKHCDFMAESIIEDFRKKDPALIFRMKGQKFGTATCVPINVKASPVPIIYGKVPSPTQ